MEDENMVFGLETRKIGKGESRSIFVNADRVDAVLESHDKIGCLVFVGGVEEPFVIGTGFDVTVNRWSQAVGYR